MLLAKASTVKALRDDPRAYTCADVLRDGDKFEAVARKVAESDQESQEDAEDLVIYRCTQSDVGLHDKPYAGVGFADW